MEVHVQIACVLFADVQGYSKLQEHQLRTFLTQILPAVASKLNPYRQDFLELNTWGDGIVVASTNPYRLAEFALDLRDFYRNRSWASDGLPKLSVRVALHAGAVHVGDDPIRQRSGIIRTQVTLAARLEPVTSAGDIFVTQQFFNLIPPDLGLPFEFDDLGEQPLAKQFGSARLYRLRRNWEQPGVPLSKQPSQSKSSAQSAGPSTNSVNMDSGDVCHPHAQVAVRGELHNCKFHIMSPRYSDKGRWKSLADVLVEVIGDLPNEEWAREAYLIPSARALPKLRDTVYLKAHPAFLQYKRDATLQFIKEWENRDLDGRWFTMPTKRGQSVGVYSLPYDLFLNASLTAKMGPPAGTIS